MPITRSIACAALAAATAVAVVLPAQAGLAATSSSSASAAVTAPSSWAASRARGASVAQAGALDDAAGSGDEAASGDDADPDDVQVVEGTDAPEDETDVLADDSSSGGSAARRDKTSGRWARIARPTAVRATITAGSRARVTWRAGTGGVLAQRFIVQLRAGGSVLQTTTFSSARSATFWSLASAKRYTVTVTAVAADGTRRVAVGGSLRTPAAKPVRSATTADRVAAAAKADARHAKAANLR